MWKIVVGFIVFAAIALFVLMKSGGNIRSWRNLRGTTGFGLESMEGRTLLNADLAITWNTTNFHIPAALVPGDYFDPNAGANRIEAPFLLANQGPLAAVGTVRVDFYLSADTSLNTAQDTLLRSYAANPLQIFFKLRLPSSLPFVFSALKVGATASMIGSVVAEFFNSAGGIGKLIANNIQSGDFALAWCGVIIVTLMGLALYLLVSLAERVLVPWQNAFRAGNRN